MATVYQICSAQATAGAETWHDCADLDITNVTRTRNGDGVDTLTFDIESGTALTDDLSFAYKSYIRLRRIMDGGIPELLFFGRVTSVPRNGSGSEIEAQTYTVSGPGEQLAATVYRQDWTESTGAITKPRVILFQASDGSRCTSGAQIYDALAWARSCGVQIAAPSALNIIAGVALPFDERVNIKCLDAIIECLRWHPHAVIWWDYAQREPVFHCGLRSALASVSYALSPAAISIAERRDLQIPACCICYEKSVQVDDAAWKQTSFDYAPVIEGESEVDKTARLNQPDVVWATFELEGFTQSNLTQKIVTEEFPSNYLDKAWWKARETWLQEYADADITLSEGGRQNDTALPSILVEGTMQPWMDKDAANERICVKALVTKVEDGQIVVVEERLITRVVVATDAVTKTYKAAQAVDSGESIPVGVAASLYAEWSGLHCEGSFSIEETECSGTYALGKCVNITGGRAEWSTMAAMICRVVEHYDSGTTTVDFGPLKTVDADSLVSLFRATRNRRFSWSRNYRTGAPEGEAVGDGSAGLAVNPSFSGLSTTKRLCILAANSVPVTHKVDINPAAISADGSTPEPTAQTLAIRQVEFVINDGPNAEGDARIAVYKAYALTTEPAFDRYEVMSDISASSGTAAAQGSCEIVDVSGTDTVQLVGDADVPATGTYLYFCTANVRAWNKLGTNSALEVSTVAGATGFRLKGTTDTAVGASKVYGTDASGNLTFLDTIPIELS